MIAFSQRDGRWKNEPLGTGSLTIGQSGCLISAVAGLLADWGHDTDPSRLNAYLKANAGYVKGNLFVFDAINRLGIRLVEFVRCATTPAPIDLLTAALGIGSGVIIQVDWTPGQQVQQHWVRLTALAGRSGHIVDPWEPAGHELIGLHRYLASGWTPARGIFAAAIYEPVQIELEAAREVEPTVTAEQEAPCLRYTK